MRCGVRMLIVDRDEDSRDLLAWTFLDRGCEVAAVGSGLQALEMLAEQTFDAVVTDCRLPDMNGEEILSRLRSVQAGLPVVVVSAYVGCLEVCRMRRMGAAEVLPKPVKIASLLASVEHLVEDAAYNRLSGHPAPEHVGTEAACRAADALAAASR